MARCGRLWWGRQKIDNLSKNQRFLVPPQVGLLDFKERKLLDHSGVWDVDEDGHIVRKAEEVLRPFVFESKTVREFRRGVAPRSKFEQEDLRHS